MKIEFTKEEAQVIIDALAEKRYKDVYQIIPKVWNAANEEEIRKNAELKKNLTEEEKAAE